MSLNRITYASGAIALLSMMLVGCTHGGAPSETAETETPPAMVPTVYYSMTDIFQPAFQGYADTAFWVYNDEGELDASGLTEEQWDTMTTSAKELKETALLFSKAQAIRVAEEGEELFNEGKGFIPSEAVQSVIDENPDGFRAMMAYLANESQTALEALEARDAAGISEASDNIYAACKSCHVAFWYPGRR